MLWLHGDLRPAGVVACDGRLTGVIDFGDPSDRADRFMFARNRSDCLNAGVVLMVRRLRTALERFCLCGRGGWRDPPEAARPPGCRTAVGEAGALPLVALCWFVASCVEERPTAAIGTAREVSLSAAKEIEGAV